MFTELSLDKRLLQALESLGYLQPTPVQAHAIPPALEGKDLVVSAETGSGKTAAFLLPTLQHFLDRNAPKSGTRCLVLVPTRELAQQVHKQCIKLASATHLKSGLITGGADFKYQKAMLRKNPEIVIATPGRMIEHLEKGSHDFLDLEVLILDEADRILEMGFGEDVQKICAHCKDERQTLLFSATLMQKGLKEMIAALLQEPETIHLNPKEEQQANIQQQVVLADDTPHKERLLTWLLAHETYQKALVFTNTRDQADRLGGVLRHHNLLSGVLHGEMTQDQRNRVMSLYRQGNIQVLVATDVAARGLDIQGIDLVVNFEMARSGDDYTHRIGRTGRAGESGLAISLIAASEWNLKASIERYLKTRFEPRSIKELAGRYKGPKKVKASGKAAGTKKKKDVNKKGAASKAKKRVRDSKSVGKRRPPIAHPGDNPNAGHEPLRRKPSGASKPE